MLFPHPARFCLTIAGAAATLGDEKKAMRLRAKCPEAQGHDHYPTARCFPSGKARRWHVCSFFVAVLHPFHAGGVFLCQVEIFIIPKDREIFD